MTNKTSDQFKADHLKSTQVFALPLTSWLTSARSVVNHFGHIHLDLLVEIDS